LFIHRVFIQNYRLLQQSVIFVLAHLTEGIFDIRNSTVVNSCNLVEQQIRHGMSVDVFVIDSLRLELAEESTPEGENLFSKFLAERREWELVENLQFVFLTVRLDKGETFALAEVLLQKTAHHVLLHYFICLALLFPQCKVQLLVGGYFVPVFVLQFE